MERINDSNDDTQARPTLVIRRTKPIGKHSPYYLVKDRDQSPENRKMILLLGATETTIDDKNFSGKTSPLGKQSLDCRSGKAGWVSVLVNAEPVKDGSLGAWLLASAKEKIMVQGM
jgi:hypothetical protein